MHTETDFFTIGPVAKTIKIDTNATINVKTTVSMHNTYYGQPGKQTAIIKNEIEEDEMNCLTILFVCNTRSVVAFQISEFNSTLKDSLP